MKNVVFTAMVFFAIAICTHIKAASVDSTHADTIKTLTVTVSGITCNGDMPVIKKKLINEDGIEEVTYSRAKKGSVLFTVKYHSSVITEEKIRSAIEASHSCDDPDAYPFKTRPAKP